MAELSKEMESKLKIAAETCIAHIRGLSQREGEIHPEDYGILALERCYLALYSLHVKGEVPDFVEELFENKAIN